MTHNSTMLTCERAESVAESVRGLLASVRSQRCCGHEFISMNCPRVATMTSSGTFSSRELRMSGSRRCQLIFECDLPPGHVLGM